MKSYKVHLGGLREQTSNDAVEHGACLVGSRIDG